ncbi:hypothetical protein SFRURICE_004384 [Spodoptera frugiperda]|nr:hypothetical protein SFRURICE_004384 [Spodoptera frugiperda]
MVDKVAALVAIHTFTYRINMLILERAAHAQINKSYPCVDTIKSESGAERAMLKSDVTSVASVPECRRPLPNVDEQRTVEVNLNTKDRSITWKNKDLVSEEGKSSNDFSRVSLLLTENHPVPSPTLSRNPVASLQSRANTEKFSKIRKIPSNTLPSSEIEPKTPCPAVSLATIRPTRQHYTYKDKKYN